LVDLGKLGKKIKKVSSLFTGGTVKGPIDENVELLEIEPIHAKINGESIIVLIEPTDLVISNTVSPQMSDQGGFYGRAEGLARYTGTRRNITIRFNMVKSHILNGADSVSSNAMTANLLQQLVYPAYTNTGLQSTSVIKTPPYFRILYGDIIGDFSGGQRKGLSGYIGSLSVDIGGPGSSIGENLTYGLSDTNIPASYAVDIGFTVIHDHVVGWYDGKFAGDGRTNWPLNTGIVIDQTADGPGGTGGQILDTAATLTPGPTKLITSAATSGKAKLATKSSDNAVKKGKS
tara:strand:+ start:1367 stop:2233 length:867 start_codon:yes stop_codon:yes gene_type:complete